jgi:hypothetical protein
MNKPLIVGNYRIVRWYPIDATGVPGWMVFPVGASVLETISKHETRREAVAAAKRYTEGDKRRARP